MLGILEGMFTCILYADWQLRAILGCFQILV